MEWEEIAAAYVKAGNVNATIRNYKRLQMRVPREIMIQCGDAAVFYKKYDEAMRAYRLAESKAKLRSLHKHLIDSDNPIRAEKVSAILVQMKHR
jgi:hypothetical protein